MSEDKYNYIDIWILFASGSQLRAQSNDGTGNRWPGSEILDAIEILSRSAEDPNPNRCHRNATAALTNNSKRKAKKI